MVVWKPRNYRKALGLSAVTATAAGLAFRSLSRSETTALGTHQREGHNQNWHLADYLHAVSEGTTEASKSLAHVAWAARRAWQLRQAAAADGREGGAGAGAGHSVKPSSGMLLADFLTALNEGGPALQHPGRGVQLINSQLADVMLERAAAPSTATRERQAILRYLSAVLRSQDAAEALLQRPGVVPKLLGLAGQSRPLQQLLAAAVARSAAPPTLPSADVEAVLALLAAEQHRWRAKQHIGVEDQRQLLLGTQLLLSWACASPSNAAQLAQAGAGNTLADLAAISASGDGIDGLQTAVARLMGVLARDARNPRMLRMQGWLYHLLCFAADASASGHWHLAAASLDSFATCLHQGCELPPQLMDRSTLPLLHRLAALPDPQVKASIARVVGALAVGSGARLPLLEREQWTETLLQWLVQLSAADQTVHDVAAERSAGEGTQGGKFSSSSNSSSSGVLGKAGRQPTATAAGDGGGGSSATEQPPVLQLQAQLVAALQALAAPAGSEGIHAAHAWLAELIVHLSRQVQPLPQERPAEKAAPTTSSGASSSSWWGWLPWGGGTGSETSPSDSCTESSSDAAAATAAAAVSAVQAAGVDNAAAAAHVLAVEIAAAESGVAVAAAAALGELEGPYQPPADAAAAIDGSGSSWWRPGWLPWGGSSSSSSGSEEGRQAGDVKAAASTSKPSDSELALYINAALIGPVYARSVAAALLEASGRVGSYQEPPAGYEELMGPDVMVVYPQVAAAIDWDLADSAVCQALKVLCALASDGSRRRAWLLGSGILPLLQRLTVERGRDVADLPPAAGEYVEGGIPLCIERQAVRLLAMLAGDQQGAAAVQDGGWVPWLQGLAVSTDLKLSSCASRALLHIESAAATQRTGLDISLLAAERRLPPLHAGPAPLLPSEQQGAAAAAAAAAATAADAGGSPGQEARSPGVEAAEAAAEIIGDARLALAQVRRRLDRQLDIVRPAVPSQHRLVMLDGVHLFDPLATHHEVLAREGVAADTADAPLLDIVFVHGIRGGAFATWRREGELEHGQARESLDRAVCWPAAWLAPEIPEARLLSLEYAAPATGWEGESLPFQHLVAQLMEKLAAAGVGQRPVIFICHSMGGLVIKDLLVTAKQQQDERLRSLNTSAAGAVFYSVPHAGSRLADWGWYLRYVGGSPAKHVQRLRPGHHLEELNAAVRAMCKSGQLSVLSFNEGLPTKLAYIPTQVVPHESAYPGYGEFVVLQQHDHISVCKPSDLDDPAYARLLAFLHARVRTIRLARAERAARSLDHMEASVL